MVYWLRRWSSKAKSAQRGRFEPNALGVVSGVTTLRLANFSPKAFSCLYVSLIVVGVYMYIKSIKKHKGKSVLTLGRVLSPIVRGYSSATFCHRWNTSCCATLSPVSPGT